MNKNLSRLSTMQCIVKFLQLSKIVKYKNYFFWMQDPVKFQILYLVLFLWSLELFLPQPSPLCIFFTEEKLGDLGSIPASGRSPGEGNGYPLQYSGLENYMGRGAWQAIAHCRKESDTTE